MAIPTNIKTLLSGDVVEWARIEFKETWDAEASPKTMAKDNKERIHYIRKMSNTVEPSDDEEKDLFNLANRIPFDDRVNHQADISDLNITLIQNYLKEVKSSLYEKSKTGDFIEVCNDMNIICNLPEYTKPKNVGLMFLIWNLISFFHIPR